jgi:hypothetical protein
MDAALLELASRSGCEGASGLDESLVTAITGCYMPNRACRTAWTAAVGPLTST